MDVDEAPLAAHEHRVPRVAHEAVELEAHARLVRLALHVAHCVAHARVLFVYTVYCIYCIFDIDERIIRLGRPTCAQKSANSCATTPHRTLHESTVVEVRQRANRWSSPHLSSPRLELYSTVLRATASNAAAAATASQRVRMRIQRLGAVLPNDRRRLRFGRVGAGAAREAQVQQVGAREPDVEGAAHRTEPNRSAAPPQSVEQLASNTYRTRSKSSARPRRNTSA